MLTLKPLAIAIVIVISSLYPKATLLASSKTPAKVIAGWVEKISFPESDAVIKAKLDTGATISSIHAENIVYLKKESTDESISGKGKRKAQSWVKFDLVLKEKGKQIRIPMERPKKKRVMIKNHDGNHDSRPVVSLDFCFNGHLYTTDFTLADRSEFVYGALLGRQFLEKVALVDSNATFQTLANCSFSIKQDD